MRVVCVGGGFVGLTAACHFARVGHEAIVLDLNPAVVEAINSGKSLIPNLTRFLGFDFGPFVRAGRLRAVTCWKNVEHAPDAVLIAVPTEHDGEPDMMPLASAWQSLLRDCPAYPVVIIESTVIPGTLDELRTQAAWQERRLRLAVAPRRDWFDTERQTLPHVTRVVGGIDEASTEAAVRVLREVSPKIVVGDYRAVELVKPLENALLFLPVTYAMSVAERYPGVDMNEVLRLAGTHFARPTYFLNWGVSGYCINIAPAYLQDTTGLGTQAIGAEQLVRRRLWNRLMERFHPASICFLGLSYKPEFKIPHRSPTLDFVTWAAPRRVTVHDPFFTVDETRALCPDATPLELVHRLGESEMVLLMTGHTLYRHADEYLHKGQVVIDGPGLWEPYAEILRERGVAYRRLWGPGWSE